MKLIITFLFFTLNFISYSQWSFPVECNSGITTQLNSSCNGRPGNLWLGWACGINGVIIKSVNNYPSQQWINVTGHGVPTNINLVNICAVNDSVAFVTGTLNNTTHVWKTSNGGNNWVEVFTQANGFINSVWMRNSLRGFMQGNPVNGRWSLWKTSNGGNNWDSTGLYLPQASGETGFPNSLTMVLAYNNPNYDTTKIWFGTNNSRIYYSSNTGNNWTVQNIPEQNIYCLCYGFIYFTPPPVIYAGGSNLLKSTNYGLNWTTVATPDTGKITGITQCWIGYYLSKGNKIYSFNNNIWNAIYTAPSGNFTYFDNHGIGVWCEHYAVRDNGGICFVTEGEGIQKTGSKIPSLFHVYNAYPNPFNPAVKIKFDIAIKDKINIDIFDINGKLVENLLNNELTPAQYEIEWNASAYSSGIYFCKITSGRFSDIKKLVLVK